MYKFIEDISRTGRLYFCAIIISHSFVIGLITNTICYRFRSLYNRISRNNLRDTN